MLKTKFESAKKWAVEHKEELILGGIIGGTVLAVAIGMRGRIKLDKDIIKLEKEEVNELTNVFKDRTLFQLEDQDQVWMLITGEVDSKGNPTDLVEIGRQIAEGIFRED